MTTAHRVCAAIAAAAAILCCRAALATPTDQYLAMRRQSRCDRKLNYAQVESAASNYQGAVLELRGTINGAIRRETGIAFLLTMDDRRGILLTAPPADERLVAAVNDQRVRVLVRVTTGVVGNVVPLDVLAVGYDAEIALREQEAERVQAAEAAQARADGGAVARSRSSYSSRGGYYARPFDTASLGGVSRLAQEHLTPEAQAVYPVYKRYILKCNPRLSEAELDSITVSLLHYSVRHEVDPRLVIALIIAESDFDPRSTSNKGAMGLGQIMPDEAQSHGVANPYDPIQNVRTCINLLRMKLDLYADGSPPGRPSWRRIELALAAYNAGAGAVKKYGYNIPPYRETQNYVKKIVRIYRQLCGET